MPATSAGMTAFSIHPEKIPLADFDAVMAQNAVGGGGVEVEIREGIIIDELLSLQRERIGRADGKGNVAAVLALELRRLEGLDVVDGLDEPRLQFLKALFGV